MSVQVSLLGRYMFGIAFQESLFVFVQFSSLILFERCLFYSIACIIHLLLSNFEQPLNYSRLIEDFLLNYLEMSFILFFVECFSRLQLTVLLGLPTSPVLFLSQTNLVCFVPNSLLPFLSLSWHPSASLGQTSHKLID